MCGLFIDSSLTIKVVIQFGSLSERSIATVVYERSWSSAACVNFVHCAHGLRLELLARISLLVYIVGARVEFAASTQPARSSSCALLATTSVCNAYVFLV